MFSLNHGAQGKRMADSVLHALLKSIEKRETVALITVTSGEGEFSSALGRHCVLWPDPERAAVGDLGLPELQDQIAGDARDALAARQHRHLDYSTGSGALKIFVEVQAQPSHLIIVGAGHIAIPLAAIARTCDFEVTVIDDRAQYAHPARFPTAQRVIAGPFRAELQRLRAESHGFDQHTYIVLVTRGHQHDVECLLEVLDDPLAYIGMIGSQRRIRAVFDLLESEQGIPAYHFDRVYAPVGLDIGARTPAEIAVCIMAEIINVMRGGPATSLSDRIRRERRERRERVAVHSQAQ